MRIALLLALCSALLACREKPIDPMLKERKEPLVVAEQPPLPEDPVAGKRSEAQWKMHLQAEEVERRMVFDRSHAQEHHALIRRISAAREPLDKAKTPAALTRAQAQLAPTLDAIQADIDTLDRYKNTSRLLPDYDALLDLLRSGYPAARLAAMGGKTEALSQAGTQFDAHLRAMRSWLERLEKDDDEALEEG